MAKKLAVIIADVLMAGTASAVLAFFALQALASEKLKILDPSHYFLWWGLLILSILPIVSILILKNKNRPTC